MSAGNPGRIKAGAHGDGSYFHALETLMLAYINDGTSTGSHRIPTSHASFGPVEEIFELTSTRTQYNNTLKKVETS